MRKRDKTKITNRNRPKCGLCGSTENLTKTDCCGNWICDDMDEYVAFSYAHNSCMRNHFKYTLCGHHFHSEHDGPWKGCKKCYDDFKDNMELFVYFGTNEYNFDILKDPPKFETTLCSKCNRKINLTEDFYTTYKGEHICEKCKPIPGFTHPDLFKPEEHDDEFDDDDIFDDEFFENKPANLTFEAINDIPEELLAKFDKTYLLLLQFILQYEIGTLGILSLELLISFAIQFPDELKKGRPASWAAGIIHSIGTINFLPAPDYEPYIENKEIYSFFKVSQGTMQSKSKSISDSFQLFYMDPEWTTPENLLACDMFWKLETEDGIIDFREVPEDVQLTAVKDDIIPMAPFQLTLGIEISKKAVNDLILIAQKNKILEQDNTKSNTKSNIIKFSDHQK